MYKFFISIITSVLCLNALTIQAMEKTTPLPYAQNQELINFRNFIGASGHQITSKTCVAVVEAGYDENTHTGKVMYCSPHARRVIYPSPRFLIVDCIAKPDQSLDLIGTQPLTFEEASNFYKARLGGLPFQKSHVLQISSSASLSLSGAQTNTIEKNSIEMIASPEQLTKVQSFVVHFNQRHSLFLSGGAKSGHIAQSSFESETGIGYLMSGHYNSSQSDLAPLYDFYMNQAQEFRDIQNALIEQKDKKQKEYAEHGDQVLSSLFASFSDVTAKVYHGKDFAELASDPDCPIVTLSSFFFESSSSQEQEYNLDIASFDVFKNTGKLLIFGAANEEVPLKDDPLTSMFLELARSAEGFSVLVVSSSSYIDDRLLGSVGAFVPASEAEDVIPHFMTAPGFNLKHLGDKPLFGCSMSAPCVAGVAAALLSANNNLTHEQIKSALINGGRKGGGGSISVTDEEKAQFVQEYKATFGNLELASESTIKELYDQAITKLEDQQHDPQSFSLIVANETFRYHFWIVKDAHKYRNHVDLTGALAQIAKQEKA